MMKKLFTWFQHKKSKDPTCSIFSTKTGTKLFAYPMIIFSDDAFYYYLRCRNSRKLEPLSWEIKVNVTINKDELIPTFLTEDIYVDPTVLCQMNKEEFDFECEEKKLEYARLEAPYIQPLERTKIIEVLLKHLEGLTNKERKHQPDIAYIRCLLNANGTTSFNVLYCPINLLESEKALFDGGNTTMYTFVKEEQKREEGERIELFEKIMEQNNQRYLEEMKQNASENDFNRLITFLRKNWKN